MSLSLLWPTAPPSTPAPSAGADLGDLAVDELVRALGDSYPHQRHARALLTALSRDGAVIAYRQAVLEDLLANPALCAAIAARLPALAELRQPTFRSTQESAFYQTLTRLAELETFVDCVDGLGRALATAATPLRSDGLRRLGDWLAAQQADATFQALRARLPELAARLRGVQSITIGLNLDTHLRPVAATLLSVSTEQFRGASLLGGLFGPRQETAGLGPLHSLRPHGADSLEAASTAELRLSPLFRDLERLLDDVTRPLAALLREYQHVSVHVLEAVEPDLAYYLGAVRLIGDLRAAGLPMCRPEVAPLDERTSRLTGTYNVALALRWRAQRPGQSLAERVVRNDVDLGPAGRIAILTGPNRGGKTTYAQALGLAHLLFQAGLYVPGEAARLSPVDAVFIHFPAVEQPHLDTGRLGEEAQRVRGIFQHATRHSLVLFNESFSSTTPGEGVYLAREVVRGLRRLGARAVFVTHFHDLAEGLEQFNAEAPGDSRVISLVAGVADADGAARSTFTIRPGPPLGQSYAREIALRHGLSFEQIAALLRQRGAPPAEQESL